jgi:predicted RNA-binding protein
MKGYYCFITSDNQGVAYNIFLKRIKEKKWVTYLKTLNYSSLKENDQIIFYIAGSSINRQTFVGNAMVEKVNLTKNNFIVDPDDVKKQISSIIDLKNINIFKKPVGVKELIEKLDFIKNKYNWGMFFHGGIREMNKKDYELISRTNI